MSLSRVDLVDPDYSDNDVSVYIGDVLDRLRHLSTESVQCVVTSPPYWGLRDYGSEGQLGAEPTPTEYIEAMEAVFSEVWRVLRRDGTLWLNLGDCYTSGGRTSRDLDGKLSARGMGYRPSTPTGLKPKDLVGIPWRLAFALQDSGWWLRSDIIWAKPNAMPESVTDRPTRSHEYLFLLAKSARYHYDAKAIKEPTVGGNWHDTTGSPRLNVPGQPKQDGPGRRHRGFNERYFSAPPSLTRNKRDVWTINTKPYADAHFATFPEALVEPCILAGCPVGGVVLDPFAGSGTTLAVAKRLGRKAIGIDLDPRNLRMILNRVGEVDAPIVGAA